jgi:hypothetical protein
LFRYCFLDVCNLLSDRLECWLQNGVAKNQSIVWSVLCRI